MKILLTLIFDLLFTLTACSRTPLTINDGKDIADTALRAASCNQKANDTKAVCIVSGGIEKECGLKGWAVYLDCKKENRLP